MIPRGEVWKALLRAHELKLLQVADRIGTTEATVSRSLNGVHEPAAELADRLDRALALGTRRDGDLEWILYLFADGDVGDYLPVSIPPTAPPQPAIFGNRGLAVVTAELIAVTTPNVGVVPAWDDHADLAYQARTGHYAPLIAGTRRVDAGDNRDRIADNIRHVIETYRRSLSFAEPVLA